MILKENYLYVTLDIVSHFIKSSLITSVFGNIHCKKLQMKASSCNNRNYYNNYYLVFLITILHCSPHFCWFIPQSSQVTSRLCWRCDSAFCSSLSNPAMKGDTELNKGRRNRKQMSQLYASVRFLSKTYCMYSTFIFMLGECEMAAKASLDKRSVEGQGLTEQKSTTLTSTVPSLHGFLAPLRHLNL